MPHTILKIIFPSQRRSAGFSMMELVISIAIIGIFFAGIMLVFSSVGKGIMVSRTRTVATNLAQEKIESLKNLSYSRLRVTAQTDYLLYDYDNTYYPPETGILVGNIRYERRVTIRRVAENSSGQIVDVLPDAGDTGLKKITVAIHWQENNADKSFSLSNMLEDPNRRPLDGTIAGIIRDQDTSAVLSEALVSVVDNLNWKATTNALGSYTIKVPTGTYQIHVAKDGYWPQTSASMAVAANVITSGDLSLQKIATGGISGYAFINDRLVISKVVASTVTTAGEDLEWVELYNPTTYAWTLGTNFWIAGVDDTATYRWVNPTWGSSPLSPLTMVTPTIPSHAYFLIANTGTVTLDGYSVAADAWYTGNLLESDKRGAALLYTWVNSTWRTDIVGWSPSAESAPTYESYAIKDSHGLDIGKTHIRYSYPGAYDAALGNAFDSDNNNYNFLKNVFIGDSPEYYPRNSTTVVAPVSGAPAWGAIVTCSDGVSSPATALMSDTTGYRLAPFYVSNVATGTWTANFFYSNGTTFGFVELNNIMVSSSGVTVGVANADTAPPWPAIGLSYVLLNGETETGVLRGQVKSGGIGIAGIKIESGTNSSYSTSGGNYSLSLEPGSYNITANPGNLNNNYTSSIVSTITVTKGQITSGVDFDISPGGTIAGRILSNAGDTIPDALVLAYDFNGNEASSALTAADGTFTLNNLPASGNTYRIKPSLDLSESASPNERSVNVTAGSTVWTDTGGAFSSFTVTSAFGNITGTVTNNGKAIETGVLIIASTCTISSLPPDFNSALRSSGQLYYGTVTHSDGSFTLPVRGGSYLYNVYAWFTTMSNGTPQTVLPPKTATNVAVTAGNSTAVTFTWP